MITTAHTRLAGLQIGGYKPTTGADKFASRRQQTEMSDRHVTLHKGQLVYKYDALIIEKETVLEKVLRELDVIA